MAYALDNRGGGNALPPFLQGRTGQPGASQPMIAPKASITPGEVAAPKRGNLFNQMKKRQPAQSMGMFGKLFQNKNNQAAAKPAITPGSHGPQSGQLPTPAAQPAQTLYEFFKKDLERQRDSSLADTQADASRRGVFYGTPLTTSQGDIQTEYNRGLGSLQSGILQNQEQNEIQRLGLATNLLGNGGQAQAQGIDPSVFNTIGSLLAPRQGPAATAPAPPPISPAKPALPLQNNQKPQGPAMPWRNY